MTGLEPMNFHLESSSIDLDTRLNTSDLFMHFMAADHIILTPVNQFRYEG